MKNVSKFLRILKLCLATLLLILETRLIAQRQHIPNLDIRYGSITWDVEERYGKDYDKNGMIDVKYDTVYTSPYLQVNLTLASTGLKNSDFEINSISDLAKIKLDRISWTIDGKTNFKVVSRDDNKGIISVILLEEKTYRIGVSGRVTYGNKFIEFQASEDIFPDDIVILAVGDSYSSGEGNPDKISLSSVESDPIWSDCKDQASMDDCQCGHRSATNWSSLAAYELEKSDPHTSITYINLSSTGALIQHLVNAVYLKKDKDNNFLCGHYYSQIDKGLQYLTRRSKIDAVVMSIGGNDVGFLQAIYAYQIRNPNYPIVSLNEIEERMKDGKWESNNTKDLILTPLIGAYAWRWAAIDISKDINFNDRAGIDNLSNEYSNLSQKLSSIPKIKNVFIMQYPDIAKNCEFIMAMETKIMGVNTTMRISEDEINHFKDNLLNPLSSKINKACIDFGWVPIEPVFPSNSGYCFPELENYDFDNFGFFKKFIMSPNDYLSINSKDYSYVRTLEQSKKYQNGLYGSMHLNAFGHLAYAKDLGIQLKTRILSVPSTTFTGNFNNDNINDFLSIRSDGIYVKTKSNSNSDIFKKWCNFNLNSLGADINGWAIGDFNGDGFDDLLATIKGKGLIVFINSRDSKFEESDLWSNSGYMDSYWQVGDFNGDGFDDLITLSGYLCKILLNSKQYSFNSPITINSTYKLNKIGLVDKKKLFFNDLNNDGKDEIILIDQEMPMKLVVLKLAHDNASFEYPATLGLPYKIDNNGFGSIYLNDLELLPVIGNFDNNSIKDIAIIPQFEKNNNVLFNIMSNTDVINSQIIVVPNMLSAFDSWFADKGNDIFNVRIPKQFTIVNSSNYSGSNDIEYSEVNSPLTWVLKTNNMNKFELHIKPQ